MTNYAGVEISIEDFETKEFSDGVTYAKRFPLGNMSVLSEDKSKVFCRCCEPATGNKEHAWYEPKQTTIDKFESDFGTLITSEVD